MTDRRLWWKTFFKHIALILWVILLLVGAGFSIFIAASTVWGKWVLVTVACACPIIYYAKEKADDAQRNREYFRSKIAEDKEDIEHYKQRLEKAPSLGLTPEEEEHEVSFLKHQIKYFESELARHVEALSRWM